jgi:hypothetical protein
VNATGRGVLSMSGLSYGVVRVDQENSLTSLTLQDCGQVMPGCKYFMSHHCGHTLRFLIAASAPSFVVLSACKKFVINLFVSI